MRHWGQEDEHGTSRAYGWMAAERVREGEKKLWRHGRAHLRIRNAGRRRFWEGKNGERQPDWGKRGELGVDVSWFLLPPHGSRFGVGAQLKWGTNASETTPDISLYFGRLGSVWVHLIHWLPYRWFERKKWDDRKCEWTTDYDTRVFSFNVSGEDHFGDSRNALRDLKIRWAFWERDGHWARSDPWWMHGHWSLRDWMFGRTEHTVFVTKEGVCAIPMPERTYTATYKTERRMNHYARPLGRLRDRIFGAREWYTTEVTPGQPVPVPGKGENSWDCGDDAIHAMTCSGKSVLEVVGKMVASALETRERHGGMDMNSPDWRPREGV